MKLHNLGVWQTLYLSRALRAVANTIMAKGVFMTALTSLQKTYSMQNFSYRISHWNSSEFAEIPHKIRVKCNKMAFLITFTSNLRITMIHWIGSSVKIANNVFIILTTEDEQQSHSRIFLHSKKKTFGDKKITTDSVPPFSCKDVTGIFPLGRRMILVPEIASHSEPDSTPGVESSKANFGNWFSSGALLCRFLSCFFLA